VRGRSSPILVNFDPLFGVQIFFQRISRILLVVAKQNLARLGVCQLPLASQIWCTLAYFFGEQKSCTADISDIFVGAQPNLAALGVLVHTRS